MWTQTDKAIRERSREIDSEAARLIRGGMAPFRAVAVATQTVDQRKRTRRYSDIAWREIMERSEVVA